MKKAIVILISAVIIIVSVYSIGIAEAFTVFDNITMGMSIDDVMKLEKQQGRTCKQEQLGCAYYENGKYFSRQTDGLLASGTFQDIPDSTINYYFNDNGELFDIVYCIGDDRSIHYEQYLNNRLKGVSNIIDEYNAIEKQLEQEFTNEWITISDQKPSTIDAIISEHSLMKAYDYSLHSIAINEKESISIFHIIYYHDLSVFGLKDQLTNANISGLHLLEYRLITSDK